MDKTSFYRMDDLTKARIRVDLTARSGQTVDSVFTGLGFESEMLMGIAHETAKSFLETLLEEMNISAGEDEDDDGRECLTDIKIGWMHGLMTGLLLTPEDRSEVTFPGLFAAIMGGARVGRTVPDLLADLGIDAKDATETAAIFGEDYRAYAASVPELDPDEWVALNARCWLDGLIVARLIRTAVR